MSNSDPYRRWQNTIFQEIRDGEEFDLARTIEGLLALGAGSDITVDDFLAMLRSGCDTGQLIDAAASSFWPKINI